MLYPITAILAFHITTVTVTWIIEYITQESDTEWHWTLRLIKVILSIFLGIASSGTIWEELDKIRNRKYAAYSCLFYLLMK